MKWLLILSLIVASCTNNNTNTGELDTVTMNVADENTDTVSRNKVHAFDTAQLIVPGERIGKVKLNENVDSLQVLGRPDVSDAAMGKAWLTWKGKRDEHNNATVLNVYTTYKDSSMRKKTVQQIRTTSPYFFTQDSIHVYASLETIRQHFPALQKAASYNEDGRKIVLYDAMEQGIAFEIANADEQQICTGIIVHEKDKNVTEIYIMLHPGMKRY
ncbi:hypothetical protein FC093_10135 [Ilyomonas limi]|uniref:Uncharacterized protein n=1 Tax=Ilyomonas limi TaxID=2575867 RepID=A0A4U3L2K9_9BACT|nr:hypothetical protein [Ilyomonas limi]TKK68479.1 hypothetical protein FC093_10135 [Ilyomonas limi]